MTASCNACDYSYIGKGKLSLAPLTNGVPSGALREVGNVSALTITPSTNERKLMDYMNMGGGNCATSTIVDGVQLSATAHSFCPANVAMLANGKLSSVTSAVITGEAHTAYVSGLIPFNELYDKTVAPVLKKGTTVLVAGTDYTLTETGARILTEGAVADGDAVTVDYTSVAQSTIQSLTDLGQEFMAVFEGLNEAQSGKRVRVTVYRFKPTPNESLPWIGDDFANATLSGELLRNAKIVGDDLSKYYKVQIEHV